MTHGKGTYKIKQEITEPETPNVPIIYYRIFLVVFGFGYSPTNT